MAGRLHRRRAPSTPLTHDTGGPTMRMKAPGVLLAGSWGKAIGVAHEQILER